MSPHCEYNTGVTGNFILEEQSKCCAVCPKMACTTWTSLFDRVHPEMGGMQRKTAGVQVHSGSQVQALFAANNSDTRNFALHYSCVYTALKNSEQYDLCCRLLQLCNCKRL